MSSRRWAATVAACLGLAGCIGAPPPHAGDRPAQPEAASGHVEQQGWSSTRYSVAAANPLATQAGYGVLKAGGSAVDAAIAVQMVLGLVEPQSSGIGGGAFLMHWDGRQVRSYDGRETAPAGVDDKLFLQGDGRPMAFHDAAVGGRAVGVPGTLRMLEIAHRAHGRLPWAALFEPAITLAESGFRVSPRLHALLRGDQHLRKDITAARQFYADDGQPLPVGTLLRNPALAAVMRTVAEHGADAFYGGAIARSIVGKVQGHASNPGQLSAQDLVDYRAQVRAPLCADWRRWRLCGMGPPSSGQIAVMQILGTLDHVVPTAAVPLQDGIPSADFLHLYTEASKLAFADRARHVADPDFVAAPAGRWSSLLDASYLRERAALIGPQTMPTAPPGQPGGQRSAWAAQPEQPEYGTSHISIVDAQGQAVAMTSTIEDQFGARQMVDGGTGLAGGFLLNNELTDFSFMPTDAQGRPIANRVQPGKRPRSSMSPTLVFDRAGGQLQMSAGSPGGALIIHFTAKALLGTLAWGLDAQQAIALPNFGTTGGPVLLEAGRFPPATRNTLKTRGHSVIELDLTSGLQAIERRGGGWFGGADPRREGIVMGD